MIFFGKPYPIYSRIWPPFALISIPHPDIQVRGQILHPEKTRLKGDPLNRPALSRFRGQAGEGRSSVSILAFTLLLLVSLIFIFILLLKRQRIIVASPIRNLLYSFCRAASLWSRNPFCHHTNQPPHLKRKSGIINFNQSPRDVYLSYVIRPGS